MKELEFKKLLHRAKSGNISSKEKQLLEELLSKRNKNLEIAPDIVNDSKQAVLKKSLASIRPNKRINKLQQALKYAAIIISFISLSYGTYHLLPLNKNDNLLATYIEVSTGRGERKTIILPDSTTVTINGNSSFRYPEEFQKKDRTVQLEGEAFFDVIRNEKKPFIVMADGFKTTVLGTSFNIKEEKTSFSVTVSSGKVQVENEQQKVVLVQDQQFNYDNIKSKADVSHVNSKIISDWSRDILQFNNISLEQALATMEEWYNTEISCSMTDIKKRTIKGTYENKNLEYVLDDMAFMLDISYEIDNNTVMITHASEKEKAYDISKNTP